MGDKKPNYLRLRQQLNTPHSVVRESTIMSNYYVLLLAVFICSATGMAIFYMKNFDLITSLKLSNKIAFDSRLSSE
jgi:hypothetical protein